MISFQPPAFQQHRLLRGGHLQTLATVTPPGKLGLTTEKHTVTLADGDAVVLHETRPGDWRDDGLSMLLVHGLSGCHARPLHDSLGKAIPRTRCACFPHRHAWLWRRVWTG
ncbi:hypothetical protein RMSM_01715 [Rhodopirellula maiorica SM1]|uniref:Hydrolase n=1 Tax=Rhodopirellula maiorica SM1 TaxID=1265738 RepID=M5S153_9BACT|nr:hypothetical protein [Rhodopirellula maiorica]EMI21377.1 hypothetical protein RMSM_01715 [Rhodopirellula maiorica SM1]